MFKILLKVTFPFLLVFPLYGSSLKFYTNYDEALKIAKEEQKMLFLDFTAQWCKPCKVLDKSLFTNDEFIKIHEEHFINVKIDEKYNAKLLNTFGVRRFPTLIYMDHNENIVFKTGAYADIKRHIELSKGIASIRQIETDNREKLLSLDSEPLMLAFLKHSAQGLPLEYFVRFLNESMTLSPKLVNVTIDNFCSFVEPNKLAETAELYGSEVFNTNHRKEQVALRIFDAFENKVENIKYVIKDLESLGINNKKEMKTFLYCYFAFNINLFGDQKMIEKQKEVGAKSLMLNYPICADQELYNMALTFLISQVDDQNYYSQLEEKLSDEISDTSNISLYDLYAVVLMKNKKNGLSLEYLDKAKEMAKKNGALYVPTTETLSSYF